MASSTKPFALILLGPTGAGKTAVALALAKHLAVEIVSADSRQVYRHMDIGTAKPTAAERKMVPHHFIDIRNPDEIYSAGQYGQEARVVIETILKRKKWPFVVGGSGLYLRALLEGFFEPKASNREIQEQLKRRAREEGNLVLHAELSQIDPTTAASLHPNDTHRMVRALEIYYASGKLPSEVRLYNSQPAAFVYRLIGLSLARSVNQRVDGMLAAGLIDECRNLVKMGYSPDLNALQTVGYQEVFQYLRDEISYHRMVELIKQHSRNYAKRQMTWFRKMSDVEWLEVKPEDTPEKIAASIRAYLKL
jgi:tRNA dimethylallyltransferase